MSRPVVFLPGIRGTNLIDSNSLSHRTIFHNLGFDGDAFTLNDDGETDNDELSLVQASDVVDIAYADLVRAVRKKVTDRIYLFGYDWRKSNEVNSELLLTWLRKLQKKLNVESFDFIAHSMGGLLFRSLLTRLNGEFAMINKAVLTAVPFLGSPDAIEAVTTGRSCFFNSDESFRKAARTFPAVYELMPRWSGAIHQNGEARSLYEVDSWQASVAKTPLFAEKLQRADRYHENLMAFSDLPENFKERIIAIAGMNVETTESILVRDDGSNTFDFIKSESGDGTVPLKSSTAFSDQLATFGFQPCNLPKMHHAMIMNESVVQRIITRFFLNQNTEPDWWNDAGKRVVKLSQ